MVAKNLISDGIPPLRPVDTGTKALEWMQALHIQHIPVVQGKEYFGLVSEGMIMDLNDAEKLLKAYDLSVSRYHVGSYDHVYEVVKKLHQNDISSIAVLDEDGEYEGAIARKDVVEFLANTQAVKEPGGIIILEMAEDEYSLSQIAQIVESNRAKILSLYVTPAGAKMEVTLKINKNDLGSVIKTFERYEYNVKATHQETEHFKDMQERLDSFMHFLSI